MDQDKKEDNSNTTVPQVQGEVFVVTTDEEAIAVPIAETSPLATEQKEPQEQARTPQTRQANRVVEDSGFDCLLCGDAKIRKLGPGSNIFVNLCGNVYMDLRDSSYPGGSSFNIWVGRLCGDVRMLVPRGTKVTIRRILLCGNRDILVREPEEGDETVTSTDPLLVTINVLMLCGDVKVRSDDCDM